MVFHTRAQLCLARLAGLRELRQSGDVLVLVLVGQEIVPVVVNLRLELLNLLDEALRSGLRVLAVGELGGRSGTLGSHRLGQVLVGEHVHGFGNGVCLALLGGGKGHSRIRHRSGIGLAAFGEAGAVEQGGEVVRSGYSGRRGDLHNGLAIPAKTEPEALFCGDVNRPAKGAYELCSRSHNGAGRVKADDFELAHEAGSQRGFALIEQGGSLAHDLCVGASPPRAVHGFYALNISVRSDRISPGGRYKENVEAFFLAGQRVPLHNDNYVFCHLAIPPLLLNIPYGVSRTLHKSSGHRVGSYIGEANIKPVPAYRVLYEKAGTACD